MLRTVIPRRAAAVLAGGVLAAAGAVVLSAPAASAAEVSWTSQCVNPMSPGVIPPSETKVEITVDPAKPTYKVGEQVTVNWLWKSYSTVPDPVIIPNFVLPADSTLPKGTITLSGAQSGELNVEGERKNAATPVGEPLIITNMKASLTLTGEGTLDLTPKEYLTDSFVFQVTAVTTCKPAPGSVPPKALSLTVEAGTTVEPATVGAPDRPLNPGEAVPLTGTKFPANASPATAALCKSDHTECDPATVTANALTVDAQGNLSGTAKLGTTIPDGEYALRVSAGGKEAFDAVTIFNPPVNRSITLSTSSGPLGTRVVIKGTGFTPNSAAQFGGLTAAGATVRQTLVPIKPDGTFTGTYPITSDQIVQLGAWEPSNRTGTRVTLPFEVVPGAAAYQDVKVALAAGGLTMTQAGAGIDFGSATLNGQAQTLNANLNQVTVVDARGGNAGWSLVGSLSDLTAANGTDKLPAGSVAWTPSCVKSESSLSDVMTGSAGPLGETASALCSQQASASSVTGGRFTADAAMTLTTPEFAPAGSYSGTLTLTLS